MSILVYVSDWGTFEIPEHVLKTIKFNKKGKPRKTGNLSYDIWLHNEEVAAGKPNDCIFETDKYGWKNNVYSLPEKPKCQ